LILKLLTADVKNVERHGKMIINIENINTLWTGDADLRLYITTVQDG